MTSKLVSRLAGVLGCLSFAAPAYAQATSTFTIQVTGTVTTGAEPVAFSGPIQITSTVVTDPAGGPPTAVVSIDARQLTARGAISGTAFVNSGQAHLTRPLAATDVIQTTFSFFPPGAGGFLKPRTALATLNLTYNVATGGLIAGTGSISTPSFP